MKVNGQEIITTIENFFSSNNSFFIPYFQRNYSWEVKIQIDMLLKDTFYYKNDDLYNKNNHFWGIVVSKEDKDLDGNKKLLIIDGQQRVATFSLVFKVLLKEFKEYLSDEQLEMLNNFLKFSDLKSKLKLQMDNNKQDNTVYMDIINDKEVSNVKNKLYLAFDSIERNLKLNLKGKEEVSNYFNKLIKTSIVHIIVENDEDNPQNVFESLNSKGMEIAIADLVKNYIFMNISSQEMQQQLYKNYWKKIENGVNQSDKEIANFLRDYMVIKFKDVIQEMNKELYYKFREKIKFNDKNISNTLEDIIYWFNLFLSCSNNFNNGSLKDHARYKIYEKINNIMSKTFIYYGLIKLGYVILMVLADLFFKEIIDENKLKKSVELINNYVFMWEFRSSRGHLHNGLINIIKEIMSNETIENVGKVIQEQLFLNKGQYSILQKQEYKQAFSSSTAKTLNEYITKFLEVRLSKIPINILNKKDENSKKWNIEHIYPTSPQESQKSNRIFQLDRIMNMGNLILLESDINLKVKNNDFKEKKQEYNKSKLKMVELILKHKDWEIDQMFENANEKFQLFYDYFKIEYKKPIF